MTAKKIDIATKDRHPWKVRRVDGKKNLFQVCHYDVWGNMTPYQGFWTVLEEAQQFADYLNGGGHV